MKKEIDKQLELLISPHAIEVIKTMFHVDVTQTNDCDLFFDDNDLISKTMLFQDNIEIPLKFAFKRNFLTELITNTYGLIMSTHETVMEDSACEVTNIISGKLLSSLNEREYNFRMRIPKIEYNPHSLGASDQNNVNVFLNHMNSGFLVNYQSKEQ